jgi:hypothetical protein
MTVKMAVFLVAGVAFNPASPLGSTQTGEQLHFSAEDETVERPIVLPPGVLAFLRKDPDVVTVLDAVKKGGEIPQAWVMAPEVHLNAPAEKDIVVTAAGPLAGANVTTFWVFRPVRQDFQLLLKGSAHDLEVKNWSAVSDRRRPREVTSCAQPRIGQTLVVGERRYRRMTIRTKAPV